ncbi:hypothetical protein Q4595_05715 [Wenyingzhuangia sp. 1_MG-2023]|nr:hypothetical protein [Wenyingzhuangia sp. 1_MG-2023]
MKKIKVQFTLYNNQKYDYYIIDKKTDAKEVEIDSKSLAYKIEGKGKYKISNYAGLPFGNLNYLLEIRNKDNSEFRGLELVTKN